MRKNILERFLRYAKIDTQSAEGQAGVPSTEKQFDLARLLKAEMESMGLKDVSLDEHCYVMGTLPANTDEKLPRIGFISHMDTSPDASGKDVKPIVWENYDGGDLTLSPGIVLKTADFPEIAKYKGSTLITSDGTTLLGADDKAGVAEILSAVEYLQAHPEIKHGDIRIGFTPDEEVGCGADLFDVAGFGADVAYTIDGGALGELEYENFNAASAKVKVHGFSIHPGSAKNKMKNAILMAMEFQNMLPVFENPMCTEGYEGFFHLHDMSGSVTEARLRYIIRDHDMEKFEEKKAVMAAAADFINRKYGAGTLELTVKDSYYNMKKCIEPCMYVVERAKKAMAAAGMNPVEVPIRGGTDGARLSYEGLPCPNLCTGGENYHGRFEFIPTEDMEKCVRMLVEILTA